MKILITGGAGFIGSNLVDHFLGLGHEVVCLDDLSTGYEINISHNFCNPMFTFIKGDIRNMQTCRQAVSGCDYVSHQAALGSVPRSIKDPVNTNSVNIDGFLNVLIAARDENIKRFVYASSSSVYGDSPKLPKVEEEIGKPLSPYAVTKQVNEFYAEVFSRTYRMQCIGLRYFNVFGKRQDSNGAYAAVIPLWINKLINYEIPVINGDGNYSRDFTYIDNVLQANEKALFTPDYQIRKGQREYFKGGFDENTYSKQDSLNSHNSSICMDDSNSQSPKQSNSPLTGYYFSEVCNIAYGGNTTLNQLFLALRNNLANYDEKIGDIEPIYGPNRAGDIPHSQASTLKAKTLIDYRPEFDIDDGLRKSSMWYFNHLGN